MLFIIDHLVANEGGSSRRDRFRNTIPGVNEQQFQRSRYLQLYNQTASDPSIDSVIKSLILLEGITDESHPIICFIRNGNSEEGVLKAYSSSEKVGSIEFYLFINQQLCNDDENALRKLMPYIRSATKQINHNGPHQPQIVYRGMYITEENRHFFVPGRVFRFPGFTSTSERDEIAKDFGNVVFQIKIPGKCHQVRDIASISCFKYEAEWLFVPYSRFRVEATIGRQIVLESLDNLVPSSY
jgi:hypothetical protein